MFEVTAKRADEIMSHMQPCDRETVLREIHGRGDDARDAVKILETIRRVLCDAVARPLTSEFLETRLKPGSVDAIDRMIGAPYRKGGGPRPPPRKAVSPPATDEVAEGVQRGADEFQATKGRYEGLIRRIDCMLRHEASSSDLF